jgi:hypothetical protein
LFIKSIARCILRKIFALFQIVRPSLKELYDINATSIFFDKGLPETSEVISTKEKQGWSELKKRSMYILALLFMAFITWAATFVFQIHNPFSGEKIVLISPLDESSNRENKNILFKWKEVKDAQMYILLIERNNPVNSK